MDKFICDLCGREILTDVIYFKEIENQTLGVCDSCDNRLGEEKKS